MNQAKREAEQRGETVTALIQEGLRLVLAQSNRQPLRARVALPVSKAGGGVLPGVDLNDSASLLDLMEPDAIGAPGIALQPGIVLETSQAKGRG
jgi:hypothetical protein